MSRARVKTLAGRLVSAHTFNPPRRATSRVPQPPVCLTRPPSRCSRCGAMRGDSELVQRRSSLVCADAGGCKS